VKPIQYVTGDATAPQKPTHERAIIAHVCNDWGGWGAGFVLALSAKSPEPERAYRAWHREKDVLPKEVRKLHGGVCFELGEIQLAQFVPHDVFVANMIAQTHRSEDGIPLSYVALRHCLEKLAAIARIGSCSVHMPRIGCGLAGGEWSEVSRIIMQTLCIYNIDVKVYDLPAVKQPDEQKENHEQTDETPR
jgi:O-acetyl-ADP-ribose deacetylase (regulator of RNase III)